MRPEVVETPKKMYGKSWEKEHGLRSVFQFYSSPWFEPLVPSDFMILSCIPSNTGRESLTKIMRSRQMEPMYSPYGVRRLMTAGYIRVEKGDKDLILVRTSKKCPQ
jgi:hypothetical protein